MTRQATAALTPLLLMLLACPMKSAMWIVDGSTAARLEFGISDERLGTRSIQWGGLVVSDCRGDTTGNPKRHWVLERNQNRWNRNWPNRITYGQAPVDFTTTLGPEELAPGCYEASVLGTGSVAFVVEKSGLVRELRSSKLGPPPDTSRGPSSGP